MQERKPTQILIYGIIISLKDYIPFSKVLTKEFREVISSRQKKHLPHHKKLSVAADDKQKQLFFHQSFPQTQSAMLQFLAGIHAEEPQTAAFL